MKLRKMVLLSVLSAALMLVGVAVISAQDDAPRVWLSAENIEVAAGEEFTITVQVRDAVEVYGGSFKLAYDPQVLEVVLVDNTALTPGTFFADQAGFTLKNTAADGVIEYALTLTQPAQPVSGDGVIGTVTFRALTTGAVEIAPIEARLLSPVFTEVDGRQVAQQINEVVAGAESVVMNPANGQPAPVVLDTAEQPAAQPQVAAPAAPQGITAPVTSYTTPVTGGGPSPIVLVGGLLFVAGLALFTLSLGAYVSLRRQPEMREMSW